MRSPMLKRLVPLLLKITITATLLWMATRNLDFAEVRQRLPDTHLGYFGLSMMLMMLTVIVGARRWYLILVHYPSRIGFPPRCMSLVPAVGVAPSRHRNRYASSARLDGEHQARTSLTGKPIRDGYATPNVVTCLQHR